MRTSGSTLVHLLLARVDLVVLDLSGYRPANSGTQFGLQRVIDWVPVDRAAHANHRYSTRPSTRCAA
jgi:hypothetical protein